MPGGANLSVSECEMTILKVSLVYCWMITSKFISLIFLCLIILNFYSCDKKSQEIPKEFKSIIAQNSISVGYKEIVPFYGGEHLPMPTSITKSEVLEDIQMFEYLLNTSYSGLEYWENRGVDFNSCFADLRDFINEKDTVFTYEFEQELAKILKQIYDGHIALIGSGYNMAYRHKAVYYCDILVEKTNNGLFRVIDSQLDMVAIGDLFTQKDRDEFLFRTLSPGGKDHFLIGVFSYESVSLRSLSFNGKSIQIPFHKSRLIHTKFNDPVPFYVEWENDIPIVRVSSFTDKRYPEMKKFMKSGNDLKNENTILVNLFYNGGGSSVFPQTFIKNLNGVSHWENHWAKLTSPAIAEYFAKYDLSSRPEISLEFRNLILSFKRRYKLYYSSPVKNWEFGSTNNQKLFGNFKGTLILLTNRRVLSAAEAMVGYSQSVKNSITIGENTGGVVQFSDDQQYYLPNSKIIAKLPRRLILIPGFEECVGYLPDYWLDTLDPIKEVISWLNDPENYQFKFSSSYNEMLEDNNLAPLLPADASIIAPGSKVPKTLRLFSGKWFGISGGILDHLLVVEKINDKLEVNAIYSWGVAYQWNINQPGWKRYEGKFENEKLILADKNSRTKITYKMNSNGTLDATYERPGVFSRITLTRLNN